MEQLVEESFKFRSWRSRLAENQVDLQCLENPYTYRGNDGKMLYAVLEAKLETSEGGELSQVCFLRGDSVSMLVVLIDDQTAEKFVVLVRQRRLCDGSETYEHPAGMIEEGETPAEVAARELKEEVDLLVSAEELVPLTNRPLFSMSSNSDERLHFFVLERQMTRDKIQALHGKRTGKASENEQTRLEVYSFAEAHRFMSNMHGVLAHFLYLTQVGDFEQIQKLKA